MPMPLVAVVILNWNGRSFLEQFLPSVLAATYPNFIVYVADNASSDDSIPFLAQSFPSVRIVPLSKNFGFAEGYNRALAQIDAPYYVLLNSDVAVQPDWLQPMVALLEQNEQYAACQPKICAYQNPNLFEYAGAAGGWIDALGYPFARGRVFDVCEKDKGQYDSTQHVFWASGAAMLVKSHWFHAVGGFDPYFFAHQEEIDLCWRMQLRGLKVFCCPQSVVYHVGGGTLPRGNSRKTFLNFRNNLIMLAKNLSWHEKFLKIPIRLLLDVASAGKGLLTGDGGYCLAVLNAHGAFYRWVLLAKKEKEVVPKNLETLRGVYRYSIVWQHFIKKKARFSDIVSER